MALLFVDYRKRVGSSRRVFYFRTINTAKAHQRCGLRRSRAALALGLTVRAKTSELSAQGAMSGRERPFLIMRHVPVCRKYIEEKDELKKWAPKTQTKFEREKTSSKIELQKFTTKNSLIPKQPSKSP